ncbi:YndJ family protein [Halobacillus sp. B23F22_1]|uniref:YndJ family protein n=1 Tax=Halobacillus sp. B23F22_1 TaxID=3459514 RepID=UPI00373FBACC
MEKSGTLLALAGTIILMAWVIIFDMSLIDIVLSFSFLILVPLLLEEAVRGKENNRAEHWINNVMITSLPFAGAGMLSVALPAGQEAGAWAVLWLFFTILIAVGGLMRLLGRGWRPVQETVIDLGLIYMAAGGGWLVISSGGLSRYLPYSETIVQLTAVHFHYAAFVVPVVTGLFGRWLVSYKKKPAGLPYTVLASGIAAGPVLVALGLRQGSPTETVMVIIYVSFILWLSVWWLWCSAEFNMWSKIAIRLSALLLIITMSVSLFYSFGMMNGSYWFGISDMIRWHGLLNAFGFSLFSVLAWRDIKPDRGYIYTSFPISKLRTKGHVGNDAIFNKGWVARHVHEEGLLDHFHAYRSENFDPAKVSATIRQFYEHTDQFSLRAHVLWQKGFRRLSTLINKWTLRMGQINVPPSGEVSMTGEIVAIDDDQDGREGVRAWTRKNEQTGDSIFTALYSSHANGRERYLNIALPLPLGIMTGVLRLLHDRERGLILTSERRKGGKGDEGIYLTLGNWTIRLPMREHFYVKEVSKGKLNASHEMKVFSITFLKIKYIIEEKKSRGQN